MGQPVRVSVCATCKAEFRRSNNRVKASTYCPECWRAYHKRWKAKQAEIDPLYPKRKNYWEKHGLYAEEAMAWIAEVGNRCEVCGDEFTDAVGKTACIDHDHSCCGQGRSCHHCRRGLLCFNCNTVLGKVKDSTSTLAAMIQYLERTSA